MFKLDLKEILRGRHKPKQQNSTLEKIKLLCTSRKAVIKLFKDYSSIVSEAKYKSIHGEGPKILTPKPML